MNFKTKKLGGLGLSIMFAPIAFGQATCSAPTASTGIIRAEGTAEQVAQLTFTCIASGAAASAGAVNVQVFMSPGLPVTSKILNAATGATEALIQINGQTPGINNGSAQGTVSGSSITFSAVGVPALSVGGSYTVTISNIRVNAAALAIAPGVPPAISETLFISGSANTVNPAALAATTVAFAVNGLGTSGLSKVFTTGSGTAGTSSGWPIGLGTISGANNFSVCNAYSPVGDNLNITSPGAVSGSSLAFAVRVQENFASAFMPVGVFGSNGQAGSLSSEQSQISLTSGSSNAVVEGSRFQINFSNVPANVKLFVPNGRLNSAAGGAAAQLSGAAIGVAFSAVGGSSDPSVVGAGTGLMAASANSLAPVTIAGGIGSAVFEILLGDNESIDRFDIPVYVVTTANTAPASATPMTVSVNFSPVGSTAIPNFAVSSSTTALNGSLFSGCNVSQSISFTTPATAQFGSGTVTLSATATSGLSVSFTSNSPSICSVSGSAVTLLSPGSCSVTASQPGDGTYAAAAAVTQSFSVAPATQTITFAQPADTALGSGPISLNATATSGLAVGFASTIPSVCTVSASTVTLVSVGTCAIAASQSGSANYSAATPVMRTFAVLAPANLLTLTMGIASGATGATAEIPIAVSTTGTAAPAGFQMDLEFDTTKLSFVSARIGQQASAAGKNIFSSALSNGQVRLLVTGVNQNAIAPGVGAYASFQLSAGFTSGSTAIAATNCAATDVLGNAIVTSCNEGLINYASCDINGDGSSNVSDVQLIINEALGVTPSTHDLNSDSVVNVSDVQIVINAALGLGCNTH